MSERFERIDVLRGLAIAAVVMHHFLLAFSHAGVRAEFATALGSLNDWLFAPARLGYLGVQLFFVISGFCIHNSYLGWRRRTARPTVGSFLASYLNRRFWRIYPPYLVALGLAFLLVYWPVFDARAWRHLAFNASLGQTLSQPFFYNINPAFWSIAVEWQLYLVYPLVLIINRRLGPWGATAVAALVAAGWQFALPLATSSWAVLHLPFRWWFEWCLGFLVAELYARGRSAIPRPALTAALLGAAALGTVLTTHPPFLVWLLPPLAFAALLEAACARRQPLGWLERQLGAIGLSSYSLYLLHNPIIWLTRDLCLSFAITIPPWLVWTGIFGVAFVVMHGISRLMFHAVELPSIDIGKAIERAHLSPRSKPCSALEPSHL